MGTTSRRHLHVGETQGQSARAAALGLDDGRELVHRFLHVTVDDQEIVLPPRRDLFLGAAQPRSEEHTSELQSHVNLVCRLLLEKKNNETLILGVAGE